MRLLSGWHWLPALSLFCWLVPCGAPLRWGFIGDSITRLGYPDSLKKKLLAPEDVILNAGNDGATASRGSDNPYWTDHKFGPRDLDTLRGFRPTVVTILLGTNDSRDVNWPKVGSHFAKDYGDLVDTVLGLPGHPAVYLCLPAPAFSRAFGINDTVLKRSILPAIDSIGKAKGIRVFDMRTPLLRQDSLFYDGIHPKGGVGFPPGGGNDTLAALLFREYRAAVAPAIVRPAPGRPGKACLAGSEGHPGFRVDIRGRRNGKANRR